MDVVFTSPSDKGRGTFYWCKFSPFVSFLFHPFFKINVFDPRINFLQLVPTLNLPYPLVNSSHYISRLSVLLEPGDKVATDCSKDSGWLACGDLPPSTINSCTAQSDVILNTENSELGPVVSSLWLMCQLWSDLTLRTIYVSNAFHLGILPPPLATVAWHSWRNRLKECK